MFSRLILLFSLAGMVLTAHLWVLKERGFDQGCLGLGSPQVRVEVGCNDTALASADRLLGIPQVAWGYAFYFTLALGAFGQLVISSRGARWLRRGSELLVAAGLVYSGWLVYYQAFVAEAFCVLCLTSAGLVAVLFGLHVWRRIQGGFMPVAAERRALELGWAAALAFAAMGVLAALLLFVDKLGTRRLDQGASAEQIETLIGQSLGKFIDPDHLREVRACRFDPAAAKLELARVPDGEKLPFLGDAEGLQIVVFYDPNCPHCARFHADILPVIEQQGKKVRFTILPRILWDRSILAVQALTIAAQAGKYFEAWNWLFAHPDKRGHSLGQLAGMFEELGLPAENLAARLKAADSLVQAQRAQIKLLGARTTPTVYIAGKKVFSYNQSADCVAKLIERSVK